MRALLFGVLLGSVLGGTAHAELPTYAGRHVNDFGHILTPAQDAALEQKVMNIENTVADHPQVFVILVNQLPADEDIDSFKNKVFHAWGIGQKGVDNGVLLVISKLDRKAGIEVGYGVEHRITDAEAHHIIDANIKPHLTRGSENWYKATDATVDAIGVDLARTAEPVTPPNNDGSGATLLITLLGASALGWLVVELWSRRNRKRREALIRQARTTREDALRQAQPSLRQSVVPASYRPPSSAPYRPGRSVATGVAAGVALSEAERRRRRNAAAASSTTSSTDYSPSPSSSSSSSDSSSSSSSSSSAGGGDSGGGGSSDSF